MTWHLPGGRKPPISLPADLGVQSPQESKAHERFRTRSYKRLIALAAVLMLTAAVVGPAFGAEDKAPLPTKTKPVRRSPTPQPEYDRVAAKQAYEEALRAFNLGHWQEAVAGFERSYTLSGDAALLFNVAQAQRQAGNVKEAIIAYKAFLREKPDTPHREMIEAKLKELESGSEAMATSSTAPNSKVELDRLTGIWEDPFERGGRDSSVAFSDARTRPCRNRAACCHGWSFGASASTALRRFSYSPRTADRPGGRHRFATTPLWI